MFGVNETHKIRASIKFSLPILDYLQEQVSHVHAGYEWRVGCRELGL